MTFIDEPPRICLLTIPESLMHALDNLESLPAKARVDAPSTVFLPSCKYGDF